MQNYCGAKCTETTLVRMSSSPATVIPLRWNTTSIGSYVLFMLRAQMCVCATVRLTMSQWEKSHGHKHSSRSLGCLKHFVHCDKSTVRLSEPILVPAPSCVIFTSYSALKRPTSTGPFRFGRIQILAGCKNLNTLQLQPSVCTMQQGGQNWIDYMCNTI